MRAVAAGPELRVLPSIQLERAQRWLERSGRWLMVCLVGGQLLFAAYVGLFYGYSAWTGRWELWRKALPHGLEAGQTLANAAVSSHLVFSVLMLAAGAIQLLPVVRRRMPALHRAVGRGYLLAAVVLSVSGLYMVWVRGDVVGDRWQHLAISVNAVLVMACAVMAGYRAYQRQIARHQRWALRLFVCTSGVFLFRLGLMGWLAVHRAPVGFDPKTFSGPFLTILAFTVYVLLPLVALESYHWARQQRTVATIWAVTAQLWLLLAVCAVGLMAATAGLWWPRVALVMGAA